MSSTPNQIGRFLSLVLRHRPEIIGISLDTSGWVETKTLIEACQKQGTPLTMETLEIIVAENSKKRFEFDAAKTKIRASQGHSVKVDLGYEEKTPPDALYHGTVDQYLPSIKEVGLTRQNRHHVHLSKDRETAAAVGARRGEAVILIIDCKAMVQDGYKFFESTNGVWLTEIVPTQYITGP